MHSIVKRASAGAVMGGALLFSGGMGLASAQPVQVQDGLVNVAVGDVTILEDVNVGVAASVAAAICGINVSDVNVLANQVDADGGQQTVCNVPGGDVLLTQSTGAQRGPETAPGQQTPPGQITAPGQQGR
jgi:hypothetical protein